MKYLKSPYAPAITQFILFACFVLFMVYSGNGSAPKNSILSPPKEKEVIKRMKPVENKIEIHQTNANNLKPIIAALGLKYDSLMVILKKAKAQKDTVQIIRYQEQALIEKEFETEKLDNLVQELDSVNSGLRYLVAAKDTIIAIKDDKIRKVKRQRNLSLLMNGVLGAVVILK